MARLSRFSLAASASATVASVCACRSGLAIERATVPALVLAGPATPSYSTIVRRSSWSLGTGGIVDAVGPD